MAAEKQISYGLKFQARALVALPGEGGHSRWLVGTNALRDENEVGSSDNLLPSESLQASIHAKVKADLMSWIRLFRW